MPFEFEEIRRDRRRCRSPAGSGVPRAVATTLAAWPPAGVGRGRRL